MKNLYKLIPLLLGVTFLVGVLVFYNLHTAAIHDELVALYLVPQPERLTELYFDNNAMLPSSATTDQPIRFAFVVHNLEMTDYQYDYRVSVHTDGTQRIVDSGHISLKNGQYYVKQEDFKLTNLKSKQEVVVELLNKQQSIDFWMGRR